MNNELQLYVQGEVRPKRADREVVKRAKVVYDEVRMASLKADGAMAVAGHIMEGLVGLDAHRQALSQGDPITNSMLAEIQVNAVRHIKSIQTGLYNQWGI